MSISATWPQLFPWSPRRPGQGRGDGSPVMEGIVRLICTAVPRTAMTSDSILNFGYTGACHGNRGNAMGIGKQHRERGGGVSLWPANGEDDPIMAMSDRVALAWSPVTNNGRLR